MHRAVWVTSAVAIALAGLVLAGAWLALRPAGPPLIAASLSRAAITPNADGDSDVTRVAYRLRRAAAVSIYFLDRQNQRYDFRRDKIRDAGPHEVDFGGVVDAFTQPGETLNGELLSRVLPDGDYTWVIEARDAAGQASQITGRLNVSLADTTLPDLRLTVGPPVFTPNQDGLSDRATLNVWLAKDIAPDGLRLALVSNDDSELPIAEAVTDLPFGRRGLHSFDYDGGIDLGLQPPPDGTYTVRATAEDRLGQKVTTTGRLTIRDGGLPRAQIMLGQVDWSAASVALGQTLYFTLTVENYGTAPIRTTGPWSGQVYGAMGTNFKTLSDFEQSGAWRVGINCDTCLSDYPWRWALGTPETLTVIPDDKGQPQYYLMPGQRARVTGGVVLDTVIPSRNPQYFWAGLIHEDVEIAAVNNRVDPDYVTILAP